MKQVFCYLILILLQWSFMFTKSESIFSTQLALNQHSISTLNYQERLYLYRLIIILSISICQLHLLQPHPQSNYNQMENSKLIGGISLNYDNYDVTLMPHADKKLDLYVRDNFKMEIYEAKAYNLNRINVKAVEDALRSSRKDITCSFHQNNCDGQEVLELVITIQMPLLPKFTQTVFLAKTKTLKDSEVINAKLLDIKKSIIKNQQSLNDVSKTFGGKIIKHFGDVNYSSASKQTVATFTIPKKGKYLITISSIFRGNSNTYCTVQLSKGDICPGTYYGIPSASNQNPFAYFVRTVVDVTQDNYNLLLSGSNGSSYMWSMYNLIMTAELIAEN